MNPLTNVKNINKLNQRELELGLTSKKSWHDQYKDSAWVFVGGLPFDLTEGDVVCVFSEYGEIVNINLVRDLKSGKSKGFCFICYEDQRSTVLAVDNLNGIKLLGRTIRVDHVENYKVPKEYENEDEESKRLKMEGCAPKAPPTPQSEKEEDELELPLKKSKKEKKKKKKKERKKTDSDSSDNEGQTMKNKKDKVNLSKSPESEGKRKKREITARSDMKVKTEKHDAGYDRALGSRDVDPIDSRKRRASPSNSDSDSPSDESNTKEKRYKENPSVEKGREDRGRFKYDNSNSRDSYRDSSKDKGKNDMSDGSIRGGYERDDLHMKDLHDKQQERERREKFNDNEGIDRDRNSSYGRGDNSRYPMDGNRRLEYDRDTEFSRDNREGRYRDRDDYYRRDDRYKRDDDYDRWNRDRDYDGYKR